MLRLLRNRALFRVIIFLFVITILLGPSIAVPYYLGRGAEPIPSDLAALEKPEALEALQDGYLQERAGNLEMALSNYRLALQAETIEVKDVAGRGAMRVFDKLIKYQSIYADLQDLQLLSRRIRAPVLAVLVLIITITVLDRLWPRQGIALRSFSMTPLVDADSAAAFNRLLLQEINQIVRMYESDQFNRIGVKIAMPSLVSAGDQGDIWSRALSSLREGGLEAAASFSLSEILRFLRNIGIRPEYALSGSVTIRLQRAIARAQLESLRDGKTIAVWDAESSEVDLLIDSDQDEKNSQAPPARAQLPQQMIVYTTATGDAREISGYLADLAVVLACKIWHRLAQSADVEMRPGSWATVYQFVNALSALEEAA